METQMKEYIRQLQTIALDKAVPETWTTLTPEQLNKFTEQFAKEIIQSIYYIISDCSIDENNEDIYCDYVYNEILNIIDERFGE